MSVKRRVEIFRPPVSSLWSQACSPSVSSVVKFLRIIFLLALLTTGANALAATPVGGLSAAGRNGQIFLTWREAPTPPGTTFNVYASQAPLDQLAAARQVGHHLEQHSARDWWEDPASFKKDVPAGAPVGFLLESNGARLDPAGGLFVYTVPAGAAGDWFFAVTSSDPDGREDRTIVPGENATQVGTPTPGGAPQPIWQRPGPRPAPGAGQGKPLRMSLHAKGGIVHDMEYLAFGDETMGWRAGLPFKFSVRVQADEVLVQPTDRVWINRPHDEAADGGTPAIWTFWYGYNSKIYDRAAMGSGVPTNYTECRNLWILDWVSGFYRPDRNRWYCSGSSMGGCGTISFGWRHPELFAALHAHVPIVSYTYVNGPRGSGSRLEPSCWTGPISPEVRASDGAPLLDRMNGVLYVRAATADLPPLFLVNGRPDASIPWMNNPPFYRAVNDARQALGAYWDSGDHATCGKEAPADVKDWLKGLRRYRLDESFPAFANTSSNRNPGQGRPDDGDPIGWINRGLDWRDIVDTEDEYGLTVVADYPGLEYPVRTDVTLRRVQRFKPGPMARLQAQLGDSPPVSIETDSAGRITIPGVAIPSPAGVRIKLTRAAR